MLHRLWTQLTSARATMTILGLLCVLLVLNVAVPQVAVLGQAEVDRFIGDSDLLRFVLVHMKLSQLSTSPLFVMTLGAFFLNLAAVLIDRTRATVKRLKFVPPTEAQVRNLAGTPGAISCPTPPGWTSARAVEVLARLGYRTMRPGPRSVWGIRHRTAVLGFPLFHASFFVLCAGGLSLYGTRFVTTNVVAEGQAFDSTGGKVVRSPPWRPPATQRLSLERVDVRLVDGVPVQLGATLRRLGAGDEPSQESWVNHPAEWGSLSVLVERVGLVPVLWLQDERGFTVDRVAVAAMLVDGAPARTPLGDGTLTAQVTPIPVGKDFPLREALATVALELTVRRGDETVFHGTLRPGEFAPVGAGALRLEDVHYWVAVRVVDEYGGLLLVLGFLLAVVGLVWRMVWFRREVGVAWDDARLVLVCRVEYFPRQFREELEAIQAFLVGDEQALAGQPSKESVT